MSEMKKETIQMAQEAFGKLIQEESGRIERMKQGAEITDFSKKEQIIVGILPGDGVGPILMEQALRVLDALVGSEIAQGKIEVR